VSAARRVPPCFCTTGSRVVKALAHGRRHFAGGHWGSRSGGTACEAPLQATPEETRGGAHRSSCEHVPRPARPTARTGAPRPAASSSALPGLSAGAFSRSLRLCIMRATVFFHLRKGHLTLFLQPPARSRGREEADAHGVDWSDHMGHLDAVAGGLKPRSLDRCVMSLRQPTRGEGMAARLAAPGLLPPRWLARAQARQRELPEMSRLEKGHKAPDTDNADPFLTRPQL